MNQKFFSPWSRKLFADCHVVEIGDSRLVTVSGMGSEDPTDGAILHVGDVKAQTVAAYEKIQTSLARAHIALNEVIRVVVYLTDVRDKDIYESIQAQYFDADDMPVHTLLVVQALAWTGMCVEIEVTALSKNK